MMNGLSRPFSQLGIDSLSGIDLALQIEDGFAVRTDDILTKEMTVYTGYTSHRFDRSPAGKKAVRLWPTRNLTAKKLWRGDSNHSFDALQGAKQREGLP